jgi:stage V sporulation protein B
MESEGSVFEKRGSSEEKLSRVIAGSGINLTLGATGGLFNIILFIFLPRLLGPAKMKLYGAFSAIFWIGWALFCFGIPQAIARYVSEHLDRETEKAKLFALQGMKLLHIATVILLVCGFSLIFALHQMGYLAYSDGVLSFESLILPLCATLLSMCAIQLYWSANSVLQGYQRYDLVAKNNTIFVAGGALFAISFASAVPILYGYLPIIAKRAPEFVEFTSDISAAIFGFSVAGLLAYFSSWYDLRKTGLIEKGDFRRYKNPSMNRHLIFFGGFASFANLFYMIGLNLDLALVGFLPSLGLIGAIEGGHYTVAHYYALASMVINQLAFAYLPAISDAYSNKDYTLMQKCFKYAMKYSFVIVVPMIIFYGVMGKELVVGLAGWEYQDIEYLPFLLILGTSLYFTYYILMHVLFGLGKPSVPVWVGVMGVALEVFGIFYGSAHWGFKGAALGFILMSVFVFATTFVYVSLRFKLILPPSAYIPEIGSAIPAGLAVWFFPKTGIWLLVDIIVFVLIYYFLMILLGGFEPDSFSTVEGWLSKLIGKRAAKKMARINDRIFHKFPAIRWNS